MHVASALLGRGEPVVGIDNFTPYYSLVLKRARVAHLQARYGELFTFIDVDFGDANALADALSSHSIERIVHLGAQPGVRSEEHTSELQSLMRISYAVFCL